MKIGLEYFSLDVDFFQDEKIQFLSARFGFKGEIVAIKLLCKIYRQGYYTEWNDDIAQLFAKSVGGDFRHTLVNDIVHELLKRDFFDKGIFERFSILTSRGIQKRYFEAWSKLRKGFINYNDAFLLIDISKYKIKCVRKRMYSINVKEWKRIARIVFERDGYICAYCGKLGGMLEVDHIIPYSKGGSDILNNLTTSCRKCNRQKKDKSVESFNAWKAAKEGVK